MVEENTQDLARQLEGLIRTGDLVAIRKILDNVRDQKVIDEVTALFPSRDPVVCGVESGQEAATVYLLEKGFSYSCKYARPGTSCDQWCQGQHEAGACPHDVTAVDLARERGLPKVVQLIEDLSRGVRKAGDGLAPTCPGQHAAARPAARPPATKTKSVDNIQYDTEATKARMLLKELGPDHLGKHGERLLHAAAATSPSAVHVAVSVYNVPVNAANFAGDTALHDAARRGNEAVARALLMQGADPGSRNKLGQKPADVSSSPAVSALLAAYRPGLPAAVSRYDAAAVARLARLWVNPHAVIKDGKTALELLEAHKGDHKQAAHCYNLLTTHQATLELVHAVLSEDVERVPILLSKGGWNINTRYMDACGKPPLWAAIEQHSLPLVKLLTASGRCHLNIRVRETETSPHTMPLLFRTLDRACPVTLWQFLHDDMDQFQDAEKDVHGNTALLRAVHNEHTPSFVSQLIAARKGQNLTERNAAGQTARELAMSLNRMDLVDVIDQALFKYIGQFSLINLPINFYGSANMEVTNREGQSLREVLALAGRQDDVLAIDKYNDIETRGLDLFEAAAKGDVAFVKDKKNNNAIYRDRNGYTALTRAIVFRRLEVARALVINQPRLTATPDNCNRWPLHYAYALRDAEKSREFVKLLLEKNQGELEARPDKDGRLPAEYAEMRDSPELLRMLVPVITKDPYGKIIPMKGEENNEDVLCDPVLT